MLPIHRCQGHRLVRTRQVTLARRDPRASRSLCPFFRLRAARRRSSAVHIAPAPRFPRFSGENLHIPACRHAPLSGSSLPTLNNITGMCWPRRCRAGSGRGRVAVPEIANTTRDPGAEERREPENSGGRCACGKRSTSDSRAKRRSHACWRLRHRRRRRACSAASFATPPGRWLLTSRWSRRTNPPAGPGIRAPLLSACMPSITCPMATTPSESASPR